MNGFSAEITLRQNFRRNTTGITLVEFFWGLGLPVIFESTFIQIFLRNLGASNFQIGLIPVFLSIGIPVLAIISAYLTTHLDNKKYAVFFSNVIASVPIILLGLILRSDLTNRSIIHIFYILYALFSFSIGFLLPVWQNFLVKIFLEGHAIKAISIMNISQSITRIISGFVLIRIIQIYDVTQATASMLFLSAGTVMFIGSLFFLIVREIPERSCKKKQFGLRTFLGTLKEIFDNKGFIYFLFSDLCYFSILNVISFYAIFATEFCSIKPSYASGLFVVLIVTGGIVFQIIFGLLNIFCLKTKFIIEKSMGLSGILILIFFPTLSGFLVSSFIMGASRAIRVIAYAPVIKRLSGKNDATGYFAVAPIIILPFSLGLPLFNGSFLDHFAYLGGNSYRLMFSLMAVLIVISFFFLIRIRFDRFLS